MRPVSLVLAHVLTRANDAARACAAAWQEDGAGGVKSLVLDQVYWRFHPRVRRWRAELPRQQAIDEEFDRRFGVDTAGEVALTDVGIQGADVHRGHGLYRPVWTQVFHDSVGKLPIAFERFTFIDYGSGKGKALFLASEYPFEEVVGIEFARPLHAIAEKNVRAYANPRRRSGPLRSECADAVNFEPPERPLVCFFFNPFDDPTTDAVIEGLVRSAGRAPRDIFVVYCNMRDVREHKRAFSRRRGLRVVTEAPRYLVLRVAREPPDLRP